MCIVGIPSFLQISYANLKRFCKDVGHVYEPALSNTSVLPEKSPKSMR